jgi:hypothetical protein
MLYLCLLTSLLSIGFNIAKNVTLHSEFSSMIGFQESELQRALSLIDHLTVNQQQQSLLLMKKYFKGNNN